MGDLAIRLYRPGDAAAVLGRKGEDMAFEAIASVRAFEGWTVTRDGAPTACAWLEHLTTSHIGLAALVGDVALREWVRVTAWVRRGLQDTETMYPGRPISATVCADQPKAIAYLERLGFVFADEAHDPPAPGYRTMTRLAEPLGRA